MAKELKSLKGAKLKNIILSSNPCPICVDAARQPPMTKTNWRNSRWGLTDSKKRYCNLKANSCHCILVPPELIEELPDLGKKIKLRGDPDSDIRKIVDIGPNEDHLKNLMDEYNARIGKLPSEIYDMPLDDIAPFLEGELKAVGRIEFYKIEATGPRQAKVASLEDALKELPRRHVMRVEKYYIETPNKMYLECPHFKGEAAGYWRYGDKSIHLGSKWATNKQVIFHEVGHAAYETGIVPYTQKPLWKAWYEKAINYQIKFPSQYALTNEGEFFAECYSHYHLKNYHLIDDGIKKWFDKTFKGGM
ncbi:MAG: hypothetical protein KAT69_09190 [Candidatus Aminicenantes bacterium]|nr:hypothetical protein [Candidatus Aminicenantes bacterium]